MQGQNPFSKYLVEKVDINDKTLPWHFKDTSSPPSKNVLDDPTT